MPNRTPEERAAFRKRRDARRAKKRTGRKKDPQQLPPAQEGPKDRATDLKNSGGDDVRKPPILPPAEGPPDSFTGYGAQNPSTGRTQLPPGIFGDPYRGGLNSTNIPGIGILSAQGLIPVGEPSLGFGGGAGGVGGGQLPVPPVRPPDDVFGGGRVPPKGPPVPPNFGGGGGQDGRERLPLPPWMGGGGQGRVPLPPWMGGGGRVPLPPWMGGPGPFPVPPQGVPGRVPLPPEFFGGGGQVPLPPEVVFGGGQVPVPPQFGGPSPGPIPFDPIEALYRGGR